MSDECVKYEYGCGDPECSHDTPDEALAHIREQQREWWATLSDRQKAKVAKLRQQMNAHLAFWHMTAKTVGPVQ